ncbi:unnamed protein product [Caenorhabditis angaria]|uniref:Secreted protein n=1 Tax=Caenorhabditis angaria TaxID=860376 RepID=A0A9P1IGG4_9PELO|nr:unnamed protein product [Caenorhabditis angaria]
MLKNSALLMLNFFGFGFLQANLDCNLCTSFNIENHYGSFFDNPREVQKSYVKRQNFMDCSGKKIATQKCDGMCFSLNVSTNRGEISDFGE